MSDKRSVNERYLPADSAVTFMELMSSRPSLTYLSVNTYVEDLSLRLSECINCVAPLKTKTLGQLKPDGEIVHHIVKLRRASRRAERQWKGTKLTVHHDIYI